MACGCGIGAGYQFAVAPGQRYKPTLLPTYRHAVILSTRLCFDTEVDPIGRTETGVT